MIDSASFSRLELTIVIVIVLPLLIPFLQSISSRSSIISTRMMMKQQQEPEEQQQQSKEDDDDASTSSPYTQWNHPYKYNIDKVLSFFLPFLLRLESLSSEPYHTSYYEKNSKEQQKEGSGGVMNTTPARFLHRLRNRVEFIESILHAIVCYLWYRQMKASNRSSNKNGGNAAGRQDHDDCYLVYGTVCVPRQQHILQDWNIIVPDFTSDRTNHHQELQQDSSVEIELTCLNTSIENVDELNVSQRRGWRRKFKTTTLDNIKFSTKCPIIIYFHGGGMVLGSSRDVTSINDCAMNISSIRQHLQKKHEIILGKEQDHDFNTNNAIILSVTYRFAPEHPFPNAIIDCLSAASFIIERYTTLPKNLSPSSSSQDQQQQHLHHHEIHFGGFSAGGNLASVIGFECYRRYNGKIKSIVAIDPMTLPHTNTSSFFMNSKSSSFCPTTFVRWGWMAYLQNEQHGDDGNKTMGSSSSSSPSYNDNEDLCSNKLADSIEFKEYFKRNSKWYRQYDATSTAAQKLKDKKNEESSESFSPWIRLFYPQLDLPKSLGINNNQDHDDDPPLIIVRTSTADPLRDDGLDLVRCLKEIGANVLHIESTGSHGISSLVDIGIEKIILK